MSDKKYTDQFVLDNKALEKFSYNPHELVAIRGGESYRDELDDYIENGIKAQGSRLPWEKTEDMRFRKREVTIWTGQNGSYKSMILGQVCLGFISQGETVCIASPEMHPVATLYRMLSQFAAGKEYINQAKEYFYPWAHQKLWLYDQPEGIHAETLLSVVKASAKLLDVNHFVIDSLMKVGINGDDYNKQKWFVDNLCTIAKETGVHIHLVAHQKKPSANGGPTSRYDIAGSGDISNLVDNVIICYRNKKITEEKSFTNGLSVDKQRNYAGGDKPEPNYIFWMDGDSLQFKETERGKLNTPKVWVQT